MGRPSRRRLAALCGLVALLCPDARAVTLTQRSETHPWTGVTVRRYRTSSPAADLWVSSIDLCASRVHVDATKAPTSTRATGAWAQDVGAQLATNGDFFASPPLHVYGNAVGGGIAWPSANTGTDARYAREWFYLRHGWIAFLHDQVEFSHTERVKLHAGGRTLGGWEPARVVKTVPPGTLALVSGFPELVTEGVQATCSSPTASSCFPDRSDMRARHPRTAMGITQDRRTFILAVVDGRTSSSAGMYGTELAETMKKLGAWQAFNLDGGGSSQFWRAGQGYRNNYDGNNNGSGLRAVTNHWGVFAGASSSPARPGHCAASAPCQRIPAAGGIVDNTTACFRSFGPAQYWRRETTGYGGSLVWTNATGNALPSNWAWWRLELEQAGDYRVEYFAERAFAKFSRTRYEVVADGAVHPVVSDQSHASGWTALGTFHFAAGGRQFVRVVDNAPGASVPSGQHIAADAVRLVPAAPACGDGTCAAGETCSTCTADCGACVRCGDGVCNGDETCASCTGDCGSCCGNGTCEDSEGCAACPADCGACPRCGDGPCNGQETCASCAADCGPCCGDGSCDAPETCTSCEADCGACARCGDGTCDEGETCGSCAGDCGACPRCGDGTCDPGESCDACTADCGACARCGDGTCAAAETCGSCAADCGACPVCGDRTCNAAETCATCEADCGSCERCGDGTCDADERCSKCPDDCGECPEPDAGEPVPDAGEPEPARPDAGGPSWSTAPYEGAGCGCSGAGPGAWMLPGVLAAVRRRRTSRVS